MTPFTIDYLARLWTWGLGAALLQGGLVWLSWSAWERSSRASGASERHRLACLHFAALIALPVLTLLGLQWRVADLVYARGCGCSGPSIALFARYGGLLSLAPAAAAVWAVGAAAMAAWLLVGGHRLGRLQTRPAPAATTAEVRRLAARWRTPPSAEVLEADVEAPQVIGLVRPALILPRGFAERLAPAEREAVLLHELAHVARGDFAWNLLQRLVLALLWFHPAAWRLYARLRREREMRCDALAIGRGASPAGLARALVRLAEERSRPRLAMALADRSELSARLRRLLGSNRDARPGRVARTAALAATAVCLLTLAAGRLAEADPDIRDAYVASAFGPVISIDARDHAGAFSLRIRHGRVLSASVGQRPAQVVQSGGRVVLIGEPRERPLMLTVAPNGRVRWSGRT